MSNGSGGNPLFMHGIVLFLVAAIVLTLGVVTLVHQAKESGVEVKGPTSMQDAVSAQSQMRTDQMKAASLTTKPTSLSDMATKARYGQELGAKAKRFLPLIGGILMLVWGLGTAASGLFVIWQANWARYVGFFLVFGTLGYYTWLTAAQNGPEYEWNTVKPLTLCVVAGLAGKFLFDLWVEKFAAPAPEPAA